MDLKGSLVDTNLKIQPTKKLTAFLKTIAWSDQIPHNIQNLIKVNKGKFKTYSNEKNKPVHLSNEDIETIKKIREAYPDINSKQINANEQEQKSEGDIKIDEENIEKDGKENVKKVDKENVEKCNEETESAKEKLNCVESDKKDCDVFLVTADIDWLYDYLKRRRSNGEKGIPYLHTLLEDAHIEMPENETIKRNPVLEARCVKLRAQQEAREYRKMTKGVDNVRMKFPEDSISYQLKQINRQLIAIGQFIISIFAGFLFGFRGVEWMVGNLDFGFRLLLGVMCALVIALAEIYFLAKKLNEELNIPETVQIGGPLKFADQQDYTFNDNKSSLEKQHQD